jgi:Holliday junction DNA helicase RuvB
MEDSFDYREEAAAQSDQEYDKVLRPKKLSDFAGQPSVVENLEIFVKAATLRG